jgi:heat shock protein HspQ
MDWNTATDAEVEAVEQQYAEAQKRRQQERDYFALVAELEAVEERTGLYLADINVDAENADVPREHPEFWVRCTRAAKQAAGFRAEEAGYDINDLIGRVIY